ncbi:MAG: SCO family protein [Bacteroidota bacterium]
MKLIASIASIFLLFACATEPSIERVLPILGNYDIEYSLVDGKEVSDTIYQSIPFFSFLNQDSVRVKSTELKGKIWITDFFFTTCTTVCPKMTAQMKRLHALTSDLEGELQFISFSINPTKDKPSVLKSYRESQGITAKNWLFLTGDEEETHRLGVENFLIAAIKDDQAIDGFVHSEAFTLVDREGHVRGVYNTSDPAQVDQLNEDLRKLLKYEYNIDRPKKN